MTNKQYATEVENVQRRIRYLKKLENKYWQDQWLIGLLHER